MEADATALSGESSLGEGSLGRRARGMLLIRTTWDASSPGQVTVAA